MSPLALLAPGAPPGADSFPANASDMRHALTLTLILIPLLLVPRLAFAQTIPSPYRFIESRHSFGVFGGRLEADPGRPDMGPRPGNLFGVRYNIRLTGPLSGEVVLGSSPTTRLVYRPPPDGSSAPPELAGEAPFRLMFGEAGFRFHFTGARSWRGLAPYGVATIGVADNFTAIDPVEADIASESRFRFGPAFAVGIGLGSDLFVTETISLRLDARDHLWRLGYPDRFLEPGAPSSEWRHNYALSLGMTVHF